MADMINEPELLSTEVPRKANTPKIRNRQPGLVKDITNPVRKSSQNFFDSLFCRSCLIGFEEKMAIPIIISAIPLTKNSRFLLVSIRLLIKDKLKIASDA